MKLNLNNLYVKVLILIIFTLISCTPNVPQTVDMKSKTTLVDAKKLTDLNKDPFSDIKVNKNSFKTQSNKVETCLVKPVYAIGDPAAYGGVINGGVITRYDHYIEDTKIELGSAANMVWQFSYNPDNSGYIYMVQVLAVNVVLKHIFLPMEL